MQFGFLIFPELIAIMPIVVPIAFAILAAVICEVALVVKKSIPEGLPDVIAVVGFISTTLYVYMLGLEVWNNNIQTFVWSWNGIAYGPPLGVVFAVDQFSVVMMGLFSFLGLIVSIYSIGYMKGDTGMAQYYILLLLMVASMNGVVISGDLFTLFLFYETMSVSSFVLVAFRRTWEGAEAAIKYLLMSAVGSTLILLSASYLYGLTGTLNLGLMSQLLQANPEHPLVPILVGLLTAGFGVKGAIVPFSAWLADAHPAAPSGISAMLSGVVIKVGIYGIMRVNTLLFPLRTLYFNWPLLIAIFALITMTAGSFWALTQSDIKRMLAYSSIMQIGFILFAYGTGTEFGYQAGTFYLIVHALTKSLLFLCAGAFLHTSGTRNLEELQGIGKTMPLASGFFAIGVLSLMGMPPLAGFFAKFLIFAAGAQAGMTGIVYYLSFTFIGIFNALLGLGFYLRLLYIIWLKPQSEIAKHAHHSRPSMIAAMLSLSVCLVLIGIYPGPIYDIASAAGSALYNFGEFVTGILGAGAP